MGPDTRLRLCVAVVCGEGRAAVLLDVTRRCGVCLGLGIWKAWSKWSLLSTFSRAVPEPWASGLPVTMEREALW